MKSARVSLTEPDELCTYVVIIYADAISRVTNIYTAQAPLFLAANMLKKIMLSISKELTITSAVIVVFN